MIPVMEYDRDVFQSQHTFRLLSEPIEAIQTGDKSGFLLFGYRSINDRLKAIVRAYNRKGLRPWYDKYQVYRESNQWFLLDGTGEKHLLRH